MGTRGRGITRLPKLHVEWDRSGGKRCKIIDFDKTGKFFGDDAHLFSSFWGDLVWKHVGQRYIKWKRVPNKLKRQFMGTNTGRQHAYMMHECNYLINPDVFFINCTQSGTVFCNR